MHQKNQTHERNTPYNSEGVFVFDDILATATAIFNIRVPIVMMIATTMMNHHRLLLLYIDDVTNNSTTATTSSNRPNHDGQLPKKN